VILESQCKFFVTLLNNPEVIMTSLKLDILPPHHPNFRHIFIMKTLNSGQHVRVLTLQLLQFLLSYILVLQHSMIRQVKLLSSEGDEIHPIQSVVAVANLQRNCTSLTVIK